MDDKISIPPSRIGPVIFIAIQIGGFALLWGRDTPPTEYVYLPTTTDKTAAVSAASSPVVAVSPPDEKALREIIRTVLEQELAPYARQVATAPEASRKMVPVSPPGVKENSPENIQAYTGASALLDSALAAGQWTAETNFRMQAYSNNLTPEQHERLLDMAGQAFINKRLTAEDNSFPLF